MDYRRLRAAVQHVSRLPEVITCLGAMQRAPEVVAGYVGLKRLTLPYTARFRNGLAFKLEEYYDLETLWQISFHAVYPLRPTDDVIIDAGANVGLFTCWAASRNPRASIVAVEPSPENFKRLQEHLRLNRLEQRVQALQVALGSDRTTAWLSTTASAGQMLHLTDQSTPQAVAVEAIPLADLLSQVPQRQIDFLKMDIEGSEYGVLMSVGPDQLARVRRLTVEYHPPASDRPHAKADLVRHLIACGYRSLDDRPGRAGYGLIHASRD
ncbi:MAG TPA: FkbM family methyltransferase [Vicinamibacterales bacterium]|nr:FkbM family methyltransferase [Vicinamibacterales bacterium]